MRQFSALIAAAALAACHQQARKPLPLPSGLKTARPSAAEAAPTLQPAPESKSNVQTLGQDPAAGCMWLQSDGLVTVGEQDSKYQARAAAISEARKASMQSYLGLDVQNRFMVFDQEGLRGHGPEQEQLIENILKTTRLGRILKEDVVSEGYQDAGDCKDCRYHVDLKTCLAAPAAGHDKDFHARLDLSQTHFVDGNEAKISVSASEDCYVYLYNVDMDWTTALLVPNQLVPEVHLKAGEVFEYPDDSLHKSGIRLVAQIPEGREVSAETIRLVATKTPLRRDEQDPAMGGYLSLMRRLNASDTDWTDDAQAFTIYKH